MTRTAIARGTRASRRRQLWAAALGASVLTGLACALISASGPDIEPAAGTGAGPRLSAFQVVLA